MRHSHKGYLQRIRQRFRREISRRVARRPFQSALSYPIISFTFDDFPKNAATVGAQILGEYNISATYYVSFGLLGTIAPTGEIATHKEIERILTGGHELGCHTFDHRDAWRTAPDEFEMSIQRNRMELDRSFPGVQFNSISYPINCPNPSVKRVSEAYFEICRSGGQNSNQGILDRNALRAFFLERSHGNFSAVTNLIDHSCNSNAWLIFATHDIDDTPSPYGCTPDYFERVVHYAAGSGATCLPIRRAWERLREANSAISPAKIKNTR